MNTESPVGPNPDPSSSDAPQREDAPIRKVIKIGSQRTPAPLRSEVVEESTEVVADETEASLSEPSSAAAAPEAPPAATDDSEAASEAQQVWTEEKRTAFPPPRIERVSAELQQEIDAVLGDASLDELFSAHRSHATRGPEPEVDQRLRAVVVKVHRDDVFVTLPGGFEGAVPLKQFVEAPSMGDAIDVVVSGWNQDDGLYQLRVTGASVTVADWSDLQEGLVVEARITGHNTGGLEAEVNQIRGFIPVSQVALYRVEDLSQFVGERMVCVVTEANPRRGNLVLSRRAILEREREAAREDLLAAIEPGQIREGVVRSLRDFGAFVDLGGVDGLIHVSKLSWDKIGHPREVVEEGQRVKVKVEKVDPATGRIGLSYRDLMTQPWENAAQRFHEGAVATGTVTKITDFGAFVRLEAGIEGLVHISELAHHRVSRVDSVVKVGDEIQVKILDVDVESQRMSLSRKAALTAMKKEEASEEPEETSEQIGDPPAAPQSSRVLRGGMDRRTGGDQFGLKW